MRRPAITSIFHYTDKSGYNGIRAHPTWRFRIADPPAEHQEVGAYFTSKPPDWPNLASRLQIPRRKIEYFFNFKEDGALSKKELVPVEGDRGEFIFFSKVDYLVQPNRQVDSGENPNTKKP